MLNALRTGWWLLVMRGVVAVAFGVATFMWPNFSLALLVALFGAFALVDGGLAVWLSLANSSRPSSWVLFLEGIVGVAAGILTFVYPNITTAALYYLIAAWAIVTGIFAIVAAIELRKTITNEWMLGLSGALSIVFGALLVLQPNAGLTAVLWIIGGYAVIYGILMLVLAFRLRSLNDTMQGQFSRSM